MRAKRHRGLTTQYASVIERLESRCLLSGTGDLVGDAPLTATDLGILTATNPLAAAGTIDEAFDRDVFHFQTEAEGTTAIELSANLSFLDTFVTLLDSSGTPVAFDDDGGPGTDSRLLFTIEGGQTYFVEAGGYSSSTGDYELSLTILNDGVGDNQQKALDLGSLVIGSPLNASSSIDFSNDQDFFSFRAATDGTVLIQEDAIVASGNTPLSGVLQVFREGSDFAFVSDYYGSGTTARSVGFDVTAGELYFVQINGDHETSGDYRLNLGYLENDVGGSQQSAADLGSLAVGASIERSSSIDFENDQDFFAFRAATDGTVLVQEDAIVSSGNTPLSGVLEVFQEGSEFAFAYDYDYLQLGTTARSLGFEVTAGERYFVQVYGYYGTSGDYQLDLSYLENDVGGIQQSALDLGSLAVGASIERSSSIDFSIDQDFFAFRAGSNGTVFVREDAVVAAPDALPLDGGLQAFSDGDDFPIAFDFESFGTTARNVSFDVLAGQLYFVQVTGNYGSLGEYQLTLTLAADVGDTRNTATDLPLINGQATLDSRISSRNEGFDRDIFRIQAPEGSGSVVTVRVETGAVGFSEGLDSLLQVYNASGDVIGFNDDLIPIDIPQSLVQFNASAGEYYFLEVRPFDGRPAEIGSASGDYSLVVESSSGQISDAVTNTFDGAKAISLANGFALTRVSIDYRADQDVYSFVAPTDGIVRVGHQSGPSDRLVAQLAVFDDSAGHPLLQRSNLPHSAHFSSDIELFVQADHKYFVRASLYPTESSLTYGSKTGAYSLTLQMVNNAQSSVVPVLSLDNSLAVSGSISVPGDSDTVEFTVDHNTSKINIDLSTTGALNGAVSVFLKRQGASEFEVTNYGIAFGSQRFTINEAMEGDTYVVIIDGFDNTVGSYTLTVKKVEPDDHPNSFDAINITTIQVNPLQMGLATGRIGDVADVDVFRIDAPTDSILSFSTASQVFASVRVQSSFADDQVFYAGDRISIAPEDSVFLEVVAAYSGPTPAAYEFTLHTVITDGRHDSLGTAARTDDPVGDDSEEIAQTEGSFLITGQLETAQDLDFFAFAAPFTGFLTITAQQSPGGSSSEPLHFDLNISANDYGYQYPLAQDFDGQQARSTGGLSVYVYEGFEYWVEVINRGESIGAYHLNLAPAVDDFPNFIDDSAVPVVTVNPTATVTGELTNDFYVLDYDVIQVDAPVDSSLRISTTTFDVLVDVIVRSSDGGQQFYSVSPSASQQFTVVAGNDVFLQVSPQFDYDSYEYIDTPFEITLQSVMTDGRHDSFETAATTDDPVGDDAEQITRSDDAFEITGQLETTTDSDFFSFSAPFTGVLTISAPQGIAGVNSDSLFGVAAFESYQYFDPFSGETISGTPFLIASDANGEAVRSANGLSISVFAGSRYSVSVTNQGDSTGGYQLELIPVTDGFANNFATATTVTLSANNEGSVNGGQLESVFDVDFFSFVAQQTGGMSIQLTPETDNSGPTSALFAYLNVYSNPNVFDGLLTYAFANEIATFNVIEGNAYFFSVANYGFGAASYHVDMRPFVVTDDVPPAGRHLENFSSASPTVISGSIETSGDIDTFRLTADATQSIQFSLDADLGNFLDPKVTVRVFDADGSPVGIPISNDDFGFSLNSFLSVPVLQGQVVEIDAGGYGSSRGDYRLTIMGIGGNAGSNPDLVAFVPQFESIETSFSTDVFQFIAGSTGMATIEVNATNGRSLDPTVTIRKSADASFVGFDDDSGLGLNSRVTFPVEQGTGYDVEVAGFGGDSTGTYQVVLSLGAGEVDDIGNTFDQATVLRFRDETSFFQAGTISAGGSDEDVVSFTAEFTGTLNLRVLAFQDDLQAGLSVFQASPDGNSSDVELLAVSGAAVPGEQTNLFVPVNKGRTYYVRLVGLADSAGRPTSGSYLLGANATADQVSAAPSDAHIDLVAGVGAMESQIDFESDRDWYRVVAPSSGTMTINLERMPNIGTHQLDPILTVYDDRELPIARNDDRSGRTLNSQLTVQARTAGEVFYVEAAGIGATTGGYDLSVHFTEAVADDYGNDPGHMQAIPVTATRTNYELRGSLEVVQDQDVFVFMAAVGASTTVGLEALGLSLPPGVELRVFEVEASDLSDVSINNLTQIISITGQPGASALEPFTFDVQQSRSYVVAVSHVGTALGAPVDYTLVFSFDAKKVSDDSALANVALFSLLSLADGAARLGDRNSDAIDAALQAALDELGKSGEFLVVVLDPVSDPVLTDSQGRQSGFTSNNGTLSETPNGYVSVGTFGQVLIVPATSSENFELRFAGFGSNLGQSFAAFMVGPSGFQQASQENARTTTNSDGKTNFVVQLGFGDSNPNLIPTRRTVPDGQTPSFFLVTNLFLNDRRIPPTSTTSIAIEDSMIVRIEDSQPPVPEAFDFLDPEGWRNVLDGVLQNLQFESLSQPSLVRILDRLRASDSKVSRELMKNSSVVQSAKVVYQVLKQSAGWFRIEKLKPPVQKPRTPLPKVTQETPSPKNLSQGRSGSTKVALLGG